MDFKKLNPGWPTYLAKRVSVPISYTGDMRHVAAAEELRHTAKALGLSENATRENIRQALYRDTLKGTDPKVLMAQLMDLGKRPPIDVKSISIDGRTVWEKPRPAQAYLVIEDFDLQRFADSIQAMVPLFKEFAHKMNAAVDDLRKALGFPDGSKWTAEEMFARLIAQAQIRKVRHHGQRRLPKEERERYRAARREYKANLRKGIYPVRAIWPVPTEPLDESPYCGKCGEQTEVLWDYEDTSFDHAFGVQQGWSAQGVSYCCEWSMFCDKHLRYPYEPNPENAPDPFDSYDDTPSDYELENF